MYFAQGGGRLWSNENNDLILLLQPEGHCFINIGISDLANMIIHLYTTNSAETSLSKFQPSHSSTGARIRG